MRNAENGNPESQTASGRAPFAQDDRAFMVDSLDRLVETDYVGTGSSESVVLDRVGNREVHVSRDNEQTAYTLANACNEYAQVGGQPVAYDAAGNLIQDEDGREYVYDEQNRLIEIQAADDTVLAQYAYDALGRRVLFDDPVTDRTVRYYFDGPSVIEERNANEARTRFHIRGAQYLDEHVATYEDEPGEYRFYLLNDLYTVMGLGDDQGNVVEAYQYGAYGLSHIDGSSGCQPGDLDGDSVIDMADAALLVGVLLTGEGSPGELCAADLNGDGLADGQDVQPFIDCLLDANCPPPAGGGPSESGGPFALHGSIVDLLDPDENGAPRLMLQYNRARYYDIRHGRWLQRDPSGYVDGSNLYESFGSNPSSFVDPLGEDWFTLLLGLGWNPGADVEKAARERFFGFYEEAALRALSGRRETEHLTREQRRFLLRQELVSTVGAIQLTSAAFDPKQELLLRLTNPRLAGELTAEARLELIVLGPTQGALNAANGVQDIAVDLVNLGIQTSGPVQIWRLAGGDSGILVIPSPDWSVNLVLWEPESAHKASKFLGGNAILILGPEAVAGLLARETGAVVSVAGEAGTTGRLQIAASSAGEQAGGEVVIALTRRQAELLAKLPASGTQTIVRRAEVGLGDISRLTARTGDEFAVFTVGGRRLVVRGSPTNALVSEEQIYELALKGWRFSGHTHPGITRAILGASSGDRATLQLFQEMNGQARSVILNSAGKFRPFTPSLYDDLLLGR